MMAYVWLDRSARRQEFQKLFSSGQDWLASGSRAFDRDSIILVHWSDAQFDAPDDQLRDARVVEFRTALRAGGENVLRMVVYSGDTLDPTTAIGMVRDRIPGFPAEKVLVVPNPLARDAGARRLKAALEPFLSSEDQSAAETAMRKAEGNREKAAAETLVKEVLAWLVLAKSGEVGRSDDLADLTVRLQREIGEAGESLSRLLEISAENLVELRKVCEAESQGGGKSFAQQCLEKWRKARLVGS